MDVLTLDCAAPERKVLERLRYFERRLLDARDLGVEQEYFRLKDRLHNRFLHGFGVVCGLEVAAAPTPEAPWRVRIGPGHALGPFGHAVHLGEEVFLDLGRCGPGTRTDPCAPDRLRDTGSPSPGQEVFVALRHAECVTRLVRAVPLGGPCDDDACEHSRVHDSFELSCLGELPASHRPGSAGPSLCELLAGRALPPCPPCPPDPWVVLARVTLPGSASSQIDGGAFDATARRPVYSTALLQEKLIECCCGEGTVELGITKTGETVVPQPPAVDLPAIRYTLVVTNSGSAPAENVLVTDSVEVPQAVGGEAFDHQTDQGEWTQTSPDIPMAAALGRVQPGQSVNLSFIFRPTASAPLDVHNLAVVTSDSPEPGTEHDRAEIDTQWSPF